MADEYLKWIAKFADPDDAEDNPLEEALRSESAPFLISRQRYDLRCRRRGGRLPREGLDDLYEVAVLQREEEGVSNERLARVWKILRGLPQSPMVPCVRRLSTVSSALYLDDPEFVAELLGVDVTDVQSVPGLLRSTGYACLSNFAHSHLGPRRVLYGDVGAVPAEMVPADELPVVVPVPEALHNLVRDFSVECAVCLKEMQEPTTLGCGHSFCISCLRRMPVSRRRRACPECRRHFKKDPPVNTRLRDAVARLEEIKAWIAENTNAADAAQHAPSAPVPAVEAVAVPPPAVAFNVRKSVMFLGATQRQALALANPESNVRRSVNDVAAEINDCDAVLKALEDGCNVDAGSGVLSNSQIVTLLRRAGVLAEDKSVFEDIRGIVKDYLRVHTKKAALHQLNNFKTTLKANAVIAAIPYGKTIVGFGHSTVRDVWTPSLFSVLRQVHPALRLTPEGLSVLHDLTTDVMLRVLAKATDMLNEYCAAYGTGEGNFYEPLSYFYVANAGAVGYDGKLDSTHNVRLFLDEGDVLCDDRHRLETPVRCLRGGEILRAVQCIFPEDIYNFAQKEVTKASAKFAASERSVTENCGRLAGLVFHPEHVALMAERLRNVSMTLGAAITLACVMEYISAEVIELAGNNARDRGDTHISPRRIMQGILNDENLHDMFRYCVFRGAGAWRFTQSNMLPPRGSVFDGPTFLETMVTMAMAARSEQMTVTDDGDGSVDDNDAGDAAAAVDDDAEKEMMPTFVDPRTGFHYVVVKALALGGAGVVSVMSAVPCPVLDDLSRETREERQRKAAAALPAAVAKQMKEEGYRLRFKESYKGDDFEFEGDEDDDDDKDDDDDGWAKETLLHAHYRRLEEIEVAQEDTRFGFEIISFESFVRATCHDMGMDCTFTAEAMEVLQTCTEAHVINVISDAYCAVSRVNQSPVLTSKDIRADRRHTGNPSYHPWGW